MHASLLGPELASGTIVRSRFSVIDRVAQDNLGMDRTLTKYARHDLKMCWICLVFLFFQFGDLYAVHPPVILTRSYIKPFE